MKEGPKVAKLAKLKQLEQTGNSAVTDKPKKTLPEGMKPWQPGQSGNPNGRPKMPPDVIKALELGSLAAAQRLVQLTQDADGRIALTAIDMLQNRLYGRPTQQADVNVTTTNVQQAHLQILVELQQRREAALGRLELEEGDTQRVIEHDPADAKK